MTEHYQELKAALLARKPWSALVTRYGQPQRLWILAIENDQLSGIMIACEGRGCLVWQDGQELDVADFVLAGFSVTVACGIIEMLEQLAADRPLAIETN